MALQLKVIPVTPFQQNCSVIWCDATRQAAVIDAGGDIARIRAFIDAQGLTVEKLLLTHGHIDHAGAARELADALGVTIEGPHPAESFWLDQLPSQGTMFGFPRAEPLTPERWLHEGDSVTVGQQQLEVLHCPGHTPGHVVFVSSASRHAFVGDVLFQGSIGRTDFPQGNHQQLIDSIVQRLWPMGDQTVFIPGHGPESSFGRERKSNPYVGGT